jgi:hypothetical protein
MVRYGDRTLPSSASYPRGGFHAARRRVRNVAGTASRRGQRRGQAFSVPGPQRLHMAASVQPRAKTDRTSVRQTSLQYVIEEKTHTAVYSIFYSIVQDGRVSSIFTVKQFVRYRTAREDGPARASDSSRKRVRGRACQFFFRKKML